MLRKSPQALVRCLLRTSNVDTFAILKPTFVYRNITGAKNDNVPVPTAEKFDERGLPILNLNDLPSIEVVEETAVCHGHDVEGLGHPTEFIRVNYEFSEYVFFQKKVIYFCRVCKYCAKPYIRVHERHGGGHH